MVAVLRTGSLEVLAHRDRRLQRAAGSGCLCPRSWLAAELSTARPHGDFLPLSGEWRCVTALLEPLTVAVLRLAAAACDARGSELTECFCHHPGKAPVLPAVLLGKWHRERMLPTRRCVPV